MKNITFLSTLLATTILAGNALAEIPSGCADQGDGTCLYQDKNTTYTYDNASGHLTQKTVNAPEHSDMEMGCIDCNMETYTYHYDYDSAGNVSQETIDISRWEGSQSDRVIMDYEYDQNNALINSTRTNLGGNMSRWSLEVDNKFWTTPQENDRFSYGTDADGNRTKTDGTWSFTYNDSGVLIKMEQPSNEYGEYTTYIYDDNGTVLSSSQQRGRPNGPNGVQISKINADYDESGKLVVTTEYCWGDGTCEYKNGATGEVKRCNPQGECTTTYEDYVKEQYSYDFFNPSYTYDEQGRPTSKSVNGKIVRTYSYDSETSALAEKYHGTPILYGKRIYTVEEANEVAGKKNRVMIRYK